MLERKTQLAFGSAILTLVVVSANSSRSLAACNQRSQWVRHAREVLENLQGLFSAMLSIEPGYGTFVLTGTDSYLESHSANISPDWNLSVFGLDLRRFDV